MRNFRAKDMSSLKKYFVLNRKLKTIFFLLFQDNDFSLYKISLPFYKKNEHS